MAYLMGLDLYECDLCGFREKWDAHDDHRGDLWECESCGRHFCTKCFTTGVGREMFDEMLSETGIVFCHECYTERRSELIG